MVNTWFTWPGDDVTVNKVTADRFTTDGETAGKVWSCVNKFRIQKDFSSGYANFGYPDGKVVSYLVCKVSVIIRWWLITPRHAKLCEQLGKWPVAILTGHWLHSAWSQTRGYILMWTNFIIPGLLHIICNLLLFLKSCILILWVSILFYKPSRELMIVKNGGFAVKCPKMKTV